MVSENGSILAYLKVWRNLEEVGEVSIINVTEAIGKFERGNLFSSGLLLIWAAADVIKFIRKLLQYCENRQGIMVYMDVTKIGIKA